MYEYVNITSVPKMRKFSALFRRKESAFVVKNYITYKTRDNVLQTLETKLNNLLLYLHFSRSEKKSS